MVSVVHDGAGVRRVLGLVAAMEKKLTEGPGLEVMTQLGEAGLEDIDERFKTQGYGTWESTKEGKPALVDSGAMRRSPMLDKVTESRVNVVVPYGGDERDPSVPLKHQLGEGVPQRKIVEATPQLLERLQLVVLEWLRGESSA